MQRVLLVGASRKSNATNSCGGDAGDGTVAGEAFHQLPSGSLAWSLVKP